MRILVTGGAGFIGSHVVDAYVAAGHQVAVVDDLSRGHLSNLNPQAAFYQVDVRSPELRGVFEAERPEVVNHHAAQMDVRRSVADPLFDASINVMGSLNVLECAREFGARKFIFISSGGAVYGEPVYLPCDEDHPLDAICPYGAGKAAVERYLYVYRQVHGLDYTILRYGNVYGPRQDTEGEAGVVAIFTDRLLHGQAAVINGSGEQERDFVYVADCARANLMVLEGTGSGRIYNLGSGSGTSINHIFEHLQPIAGSDQQAVHGPAKPGETFRIYLDARRAHEELGWEAMVSLAVGMEHTVNYFRSRQTDS